MKAQHTNAFSKEQFTQSGDTLLYRLLEPQHFDSNKKYPLILFLHGAGERGSDNEKQLTHGTDFFLDSAHRSKYPAFVVFPQCPDDAYWANVERKIDNDGGRNFVFPVGEETNPPLALTIALMEEMREKPFIDKKRIYVGGLSMGGMGTFEIVARRPNMFAAAFPICGGDNPEAASKYAGQVPFWVFHGAKDDVVLPRYSEQMVEAIRAAGGEAKFTLYPDANHNSWSSAFAEPELMPWLMGKER
jgi:predicted peptidase